MTEMRPAPFRRGPTTAGVKEGPGVADRDHREAGRSHLGRVFIATPFENRMARRGTRLPVLAEMLAAAGLDVEYVTTDFSHAYKERFSREEIRHRQEIEPYRLTVLRILGYRRNLSARRVVSNFIMALQYLLYLWRKIGPHDVLVFPSRPVELIACCAALKVLTGASTLMDIRDVWPDALVVPSKVRRRIFEAYCNLFLRPSVGRIDRFVHIAPSFVGWLRRYAPDATSTFVPPGFDPERWAGARPKDRFPSGSLSLVFVGALQHQLDLTPVLEALAARPMHRLTLIGDRGDGQRYPEVVRFIRERGMGNVTLAGRLPPEEVARILPSFDIGIVPMISSSMTNKMFDYIAAYLPTLSLGDNDTSDFVREYDIGWTVPFDAAAVGKLLDSLTAEAIAEKAANVARWRGEFSRDRLYVGLVSLVEELAGRRPGPGFHLDPAPAGGNGGDQG